MLYNTIQTSKYFKHQPQYSQVLLQKVHSYGLTKTSEGVAIWIAATANCPTVVLPSKVWHHGDPLDRKERTKLAQILKEADGSNSAQAVDDLHIAQIGRWNAKVHFAWRAILIQLQWLSADSSNILPHPKRLTLKEFWDRCVDGESQALSFWILLIFSSKSVRCLVVRREKILGLSPSSASLTSAA